MMPVKHEALAHQAQHPVLPVEVEGVPGVSYEALRGRVAALRK